MADTKISALTAATTLADTDELVLASSGASKKITGANLKASIPGTAGGAGAELAYAEKTSGTTINATSSAASNTIVTAAAVTLDGSTKIRVVFSSPSVSCGSTAISGTYIGLFDGSTCLANIAIVQSVANLCVPVYAERILTPSAGSHTYSIRGYRNDQNGIVFAGTGGADTTAPAFIRILKA